MNQAASKHDFFQLTEAQQGKFEAVLRACATHLLPCRCEQVGRDFVLVIGPGLSGANYWLDRFDLPRNN